MSRQTTLGLVQHPCSADRQENLERSEAGIARAAEAGADVVLLQELHCGHYPCYEEHPAHFDAAEPIPGPGTERLGRAAAEHGVVVIGSLFERRAAGLYHNTAVVLERDGTLAGTYRKMHIPDDPGYYEKFYFTPGDGGFTPVDTSAGRLGVLVCWDQWFPEAARLMALAGAEILLYPTAIGFAPEEPADEQARQLEAWETIQRGHAIANGLPVAACNRVGTEPAARFWGRSFVCGPQGEILARGGEEETVLVVRLDLHRTEEVRRMWPFLRDRRIEAYQGLARRYLDTPGDA
ncbi:MAG: carbon-nitrogen hydrolase [Halorhodospira halophila]|uniref:carbon-nitrogen hydrolase n=1 Tax=Halorhodospira TaxID=85108 RepID=UPI001913935E|nr:MULTISPECIES: carbon-nitrogen hydrolase [Halorhodospira]MBK5936848.1 acyltransferase [Halorhodospira halophila]MCC3750366.1 carbon-nitrogen hydrolase [Halorhodospira halophila]MCG5528075.1 carbon-nitrogen hydrolase [Halorhodospira halophila]MCG5537492.1 carbon-nitrogen hydrolase [Halorhodospira sp. 9622]MCG5539839.1 carbon-nitrogen hydrolase [Halorhodospira sp. M39old]